MVCKQGNENRIYSKCKEINKTNEAINVSQGNKKFKCFTVNARSLNSISKRDELELYIKNKQNKLDIVAITETWATENIWEVELNIDGYATYRRNCHEIRKARGGVVIIYISNRLYFCSYEELNSPAK